MYKIKVDISSQNHLQKSIITVLKTDNMLTVIWTHGISVYLNE